MAVGIMPHEQVHAFQKRLGAQTPRWFEEGHAEWISRKVIPILSPELAQAHSVDYANAFAQSDQPVALSRWGGVTVTRAAIMRQASPQNRARMERDPNYTAPGPFSFGPKDVVSDESNVKARYQASWRMFEDLAKKHGVTAVNDWANSLTAKAGRVTADTLAESARAQLDEDRAPRLK